MKKQTNPSIKAHLLWSALILLSLLAVCAIPFALAQRQTARQSLPMTPAKAKLAGNVNPAQNAPPSSGAIGASSAQAQLPNASQTGQSHLSNEATSGPSGVRAIGILPGPKLPNVVLYDQYDNDLNNGIVSARSEEHTSELQSRR